MEVDNKVETTIEAKTEAKTENQKGHKKRHSAFEAKFGPINTVGIESKTTFIEEDKAEKTVIPPTTQKLLSAPLPSNGNPTNQTAPTNNSINSSNNISNINRLVPPPLTTRLVPVNMVTNTQTPNNATSTSPSLPYYPASASQANSTINDKKNTNNLPLRGPIEMEPDEASLLSQ